MDEDIEERLARIEKSVNDTNKMVSAMRRAQKKAAYWKVFYWVIIIGLTIASIYYIEPLISQFGAAYGIGGGGAATTSTTDSPSTTAELLNLVKQYQASQKAGQ